MLNECPFGYLSFLFLFISGDRLSLCTKVDLRREFLLLQPPVLELRYVSSRFLHNLVLLTIKFENFFDSF